MLVFAAAVFFLIITPGPGVLTTAGVGAAYGYSAGVRYVSGLFVGTNLVALAVVSGIAAVVFTIPFLRTILLVASAAISGLSGGPDRFFRQSDRLHRSPQTTRLLGWCGVAGDQPKAYAVNTTLFSGFAFAPDNLAFETAMKFLIANAIWIPIHLIWLAAGVMLHRLNLPARTQRAINMVMAASMLAVVVLAALAQR